MPEIHFPEYEVNFSRKGVLAFLYLFFGAGIVFSVYSIITGDVTYGVVLLIVALVNAAIAIHDARKSHWGPEVE